MPNAVSLRSYILSLLLLLAFGMSAFLSSQSVRYFISAFEAVLAEQMLEIAHVESLPNDVPKNIYSFHIAAHWHDTPQIIREKFATPPEEEDQLYQVIEGMNYIAPPDIIYSLLQTTTDAGKTRFVSSIRSRDGVNPLHIHQDGWFIDPVLAIILFGIATIAIFFLIVLAALRHGTKPVEALYDWAQKLNVDNLEDKVPDFRYRELNSLAGILHDSISAARDTLKREQEFLQYASHELRTPISVLRSNSALLEIVNPTPSPQENEIRERINRASLTMKGMTETLLWLIRENDGTISDDEFQLDQSIHQISDDLSYLLQGKPVELIVDTDECTLSLPSQAAQILLTNLIRNAFQHSFSGQVHIQQRGSEITIHNTLSGYSTNVGDATHAGFGLGLKLCQKISQRFHWPLHMDQTETEHRVLVTLTNNQE